MKFVMYESGQVETSDAAAAEVLEHCTAAAEAGKTIQAVLPTADEYGQAATTVLTIGAEHEVSLSTAPPDEGEPFYGSAQFPGDEDSMPAT